MASEVTEALTALGANALVKKVIDPNLLETVRYYSPLVGALPADPTDTTQYFFNTRSQLPGGGFVMDGGARPVTNSTYSQASFIIRNLLAVGSVTGFAEAVTRGLIGDLVLKETQGAAKGLVFDIETALNWGNAAATATTFPQFDGLDVQCSSFSGVTQNSIDAGGAQITSGYLDQLIALIEDNLAEPVIGMDWMFVMSPSANTAIDQVFASGQRFTGNEVEIVPGVMARTYKGIPIIKSSFLSARGVAVGTVATTPSTAGGVLPAGTVSYRVSAVMARYGELTASPSVSATTTGSTGSVTLAFTPPPAIKGNSALTYRVFRSATAGTETLLGVVDANVGFLGDGITPIPTTSIIDTGAALVPQNGSTVPATLPVVYYGTNVGVLPRATASGGSRGGEDLYLISRNQDNIVRPYVRDIMPLPLAATVTSPDTLPFALVSDTCLAVRAQQYLARLRNVVATPTSTNPVMLTHSV